MAASGYSGDLGGAGERGVRLFPEKIEASHERRRQDGVEHPEVDIREIWQAVVSDLADDGLLDRNPSPDAAAILSVEYECRVNPVWPMPSAKETLAALRRKGKVLGIVSNAQFFTPLLFRAFSFGESMNAIGFAPSLCIWSCEALEAKPSVRLFGQAAETLREEYGILPESVLYVGNDCLNDIRPAAEAGCKTALFAGDARSLRLRKGEPGCSPAKPDAIVTELSQLAQVVG